MTEEENAIRTLLVRGPYVSYGEEDMSEDAANIWLDELLRDLDWGHQYNPFAISFEENSAEAPEDAEDIMRGVVNTWVPRPTDPSEDNIAEHRLFVSRRMSYLNQQEDRARNNNPYYSRGRIYRSYTHTYTATAPTISPIFSSMFVSNEERSDSYRRAKNLFLDSLTEEQRDLFLKSGCIRVEGSNGNTYTIDCSGPIMRNIYNKSRDTAYCIAVRHVPLFDVYLSQKLLIETDEEEFLKLSNHYKLIEDAWGASWRCIHEGLLGGAEGYAT